MARSTSTPTSCVLGALAVVAGIGAGPGSAAEKAQLPAPLFPLEAAWTVTLPSPAVSGPTLDELRVYVVLKDGSLLAADRESGEAAWSAIADASVGPVLSGELVVVAGSSRLTAVVAATGLQAWSTPLPDPAVTLTAFGDLVVVGTSSGALLAVSSSDGKGRWQQQLNGRAASPMLVTAGHLTVTDDAGFITVIEMTGGVRWRRHLDGRLSPPAGTSDRVFVGSSTNLFLALRATDGATLWQWRLGGDVSGAVVDGDRVYVATLDNLVRSLDVNSGNQRWKAPLSTRPDAPPLALKGLVVVTGMAPRVEGFSRKNGTRVGSLTPIAELAGSPALAQALLPYRTALVAATLDGRLLGFRPERLMMRDGLLVPLRTLPGRLLVPERSALPMQFQ